MSDAGRKLKVAAVMDDMVYHWFRFEAEIIQLGADEWQATLDKEKPDFLFVQSAWEGKNREWLNKLINLHLTEDKTLIRLVDYCRAQKIPTVFWNMEDPYHFRHFISAAKLFDYIFTTDAGSVARYKELVQHPHVYVLPFAAQPAIHNPIDREKERLGRVAFAGAWYRRGHKKRKRDMEIILKPAFDYGLHIYDRQYYYTRDNSFKYPEEYRAYIKPALPYKEIVNIYKKYDVFLNVNTVQDSPTTFSSRVLEILACGTILVSSYALGLKKMLPGLVKICRTKQETSAHLQVLLESKETRDRLSLIGQREVFTKHTYRQRFETILEKMGYISAPCENPGVTIFACIDNTAAFEKVMANYNRQGYEPKQLVVIITNACFDLGEYEEKAAEYPNVCVCKSGERMTFGKCLNLAVNLSDFGYLSYFKEDDYYGANFLIDLMNAFKYAAADIIGKKSYFCYMSELHELVLKHPGMENRYVKTVADAAWIAQKEVFSRVGFRENACHTLSELIEDCRAAGIWIYATDRFNYIHRIGMPRESPEPISDYEECVSLCEA